MTTIVARGMVGASDKGQICPTFRNNQGAIEISIGVKKFGCIGQSPPQDHPHVFLEMGDQDKILCPYCCTLYRFDANLATFESNPAETLFRH